MLSRFLTRGNTEELIIQKYTTQLLHKCAPNSLHTCIALCMEMHVINTHCPSKLLCVHAHRACVYCDPEEETRWVQGSIRWQIHDTHMLSHFTCTGIPAVSGYKRPYKKPNKGWGGRVTQTCIIHRERYIRSVLLTTKPTTR